MAQIDAIQVVTTTGDKAEAERIARQLVERHLAACAQVTGPITSTYWWEGAVETAEEWYCVAKTERGLYPQVEAAIKEIHSYDVPEILAVPVLDGNRAYLDWVVTETRLASQNQAERGK